jgi:prepilin signal peptidase PulO-like enzyme (type II secretory pathway)
MHIDSFVIYLALILSGLCSGSFAGASMWRLRARQLVQDKADGEHVDPDEYLHLKKLTKASIFGDRSQCLHCSYTLEWYDMIPLVSWLSLGGKCRKCRKPIGYLEPMIELGVMAFFVISYAFWPYPLANSLEIARLILWLMAGVGLAILFAYDTKWSLLPDRTNFMVIGISLLSAFLVVIGASDKSNAILEIIGSVLILSGIYWVLYVISKGKWIGFGDVKLGLGLALLLADWKLAFIALFAANLIGCLIVLPPLIAGKLKRNSHVPFGPLLVAGFVFAGLAGNYLINIYFSSLI